MNRLYLGPIIFVVLITLYRYIFDYFHILGNQNVEPFYSYLIPGILSGILFFFLITKLTFFFKFPRFREKEIVIKEQGGYHLTKRHYSPGKLFLTPTRLIFKSQYDIPKHNIMIPLDTTNSYSIYKMFGFIIMGLRVKTENVSEIFIVNGPKQWIQALQTFA
ncbi:MAG: hypothetical protein A2X61_08945 [Ignavibacteria bacterium GWB2_35_12]|nr:MAG: hypothetical protein A2X63_04275 [Ignavibacteria bacterium GWA2_35_8]OGU40617.1 MAG: hypothetical protein A2X61_08945 [Ignavibacteria bacterium GWB2_35_12]OGU91681.1 MAG: hypothetical protein A2220_10595 [Ignavibacteria bacterium RIFOXYA2_FULL_35_10]OGV22651.1 MAG: hypothetical protein A2475_13140 [Ignavibacteria bacterium RIFOXYC2_FULL_35_21]